jgi:hypothetical protein
VVALDAWLRGEVGAVVERPDAGNAFGAAPPHGPAARPRKSPDAARLELIVRLALIADIHANLDALEATFYDIAARSIDRIVCLGDIVGYNKDAARALR